MTGMQEVLFPESHMLWASVGPCQAPRCVLTFSSIGFHTHDSSASASHLASPSPTLPSVKCGSSSSFSVLF